MTTMPDYFEAPDGHDESTIWTASAGHPSAPVSVIRWSDVPHAYWPDVVARMTGTSITVPDKDALSALCLSYLKPPKYAGGSWTLNPDDLADAILAALTGAT
jgi:hypothetical protein